MVNKRNVFAAAESTILIKHPNGVNLFYKAGNASKVSGYLYFVYTKLSILDPTDTGRECTFAALGTHLVPQKCSHNLTGTFRLCLIHSWY